MAELHEHEQGGGSFLTRKVGPVPMWVWMAVVLLAALAFSVWQHNKSGAATSAGSAVPDQTPPQITQIYDTTNVFTPPSGGREPPPGPPGPPPPGGNPAPTPTPAPGGSPPPKPLPVPQPAGQWVTVAKFTSKNPPWNSTLWGIAAHLLGSGSSWGKVWNDPANANLRSRRKDPKFIQPGDKLWVPAK